jgi:hypothetical protein
MRNAFLLHGCLANGGTTNVSSDILIAMKQPEDVSTDSAYYVQVMGMQGGREEGGVNLPVFRAFKSNPPHPVKPLSDCC